MMQPSDRTTGVVIFDIDGTLIDSVDFHAAAWQLTLTHFGFPASFEAVRAQIGKGGDQLLPDFVPADRLAELKDEMEDYRGKLFKREFLPKVHAFPLVAELFTRIKEDGHRIALASSAKADELAVYKRLAGVSDLVDTETSSDDVTASKPCPDIFEVAIDRAGADAAVTLVVGDSPYDAIAAGKAGLRTVGVLCGGFSEDTLKDAGCIALFRDPADIHDRYDEFAALLIPTRDRQTPAFQSAP